MSDIVDELKTGRGLTEGVMRDAWVHAKMQEAADLITALRAEVERLTGERDRQYQQNAEQITRIAALEAENERLRAALKSVMIGGNSLVQIIGADHPPHGTPYGEALAHYGSGVKYEAWCCWNSIMQARAALEETKHE